MLRKTPFEKSPAILEERARNLIQSFGYTEPSSDRDYGLVVDTDYQNYAERQGNPAAFRGQLARGEPALIQFWYRQSPQSLAPTNYADGVVSQTDPPPIASGMVGLQLDPQGHLIQFDAVPPQLEEKAASPRPPDWPALFAAAGLDMARFTPAEPRWVSLAVFDTRAAWTGSYAQSPELPLRVEAASWRGKPVFFRIVGPWTRPERMQPAQRPTGSVDLTPLVYSLCVLAAFLAWRNFRAGRGDIRGASRLAAFVFGAEMLRWVCTAHHVSTIGEMFLFQGGVAWSAFTAGLVWTLYLALEPYVRRRWPQSMITWSRVLAGGFRDPLVGGRLLAGIALGTGFSLFASLQSLALEHYGSYGSAIAPPTLDSLPDARRMAGTTLSLLILPIGFGLGMVFLFFLLRVVLRRQWLAAAAFILLWGGLGVLNPSGHPVIGFLGNALFASLLLACMLWFGVLPMVVFHFVGLMLFLPPLTTDLSAWYAGPTVFVVAIVLALTAYAFHTAVAGRPLVKAGFLESD